MNMAATHLAEVRSFIALQKMLSQEFRRALPFVKDWEYLLDCPKSGEVHLDGRRWRFRVHGAGVAFTSSDGVVVDMHRAVTQPEVVDAWRLMQYLESTAQDSKVYLNEAAVETELRKLEEAGFLRRVEGNGGYKLAS
jgi:hypothetical protein